MISLPGRAPSTTGCGIAGVSLRHADVMWHVDGCATVTFGVATPDSAIQFFKWYLAHELCSIGCEQF